MLRLLSSAGDPQIKAVVERSAQRIPIVFFPEEVELCKRRRGTIPQTESFFSMRLLETLSSFCFKCAQCITVYVSKKIYRHRLRGEGGPFVILNSLYLKFIPTGKLHCKVACKFSWVGPVFPQSGFPPLCSFLSKEKWNTRCRFLSAAERIWDKTWNRTPVNESWRKKPFWWDKLHYFFDIYFGFW